MSQSQPPALTDDTVLWEVRTVAKCHTAALRLVEAFDIYWRKRPEIAEEVLLTPPTAPLFAMLHGYPTARGRWARWIGAIADVPALNESLDQIPGLMRVRRAFWDYHRLHHRIHQRLIRSSTASLCRHDIIPRLYFKYEAILRARWLQDRRALEVAESFSTSETNNRTTSEATPEEPAQSRYKLLLARPPFELVRELVQLSYPKEKKRSRGKPPDPLLPEKMARAKTLFDECSDWDLVTRKINEEFPQSNGRMYRKATIEGWHRDPNKSSRKRAA